MAAFLKIRPGGALTTAEVTARLNRADEATLCRRANGRPTLVCHWQQDADGRLFCRWDIESPEISVPPH